MQVVDSISAMRDLSRSWRRRGERVGFVPTMGNLHDGHLRLIEAVQPLCDRVVVSIYVNPLQFGPKEDYSQYPRTWDADLSRLQKRSIDAVFAPVDRQMYPRGREDCCRIEIPVLGDLLEGAARPGHFSGVATVVAKLFSIVEPDIAAFGEKDLQQLRVVERLVADLNLHVHILAVPTVREPDGLALSSRNGYLSAAERAAAPELYRVLCQARERLRTGESDVPSVENEAMQSLVAAGFRPEYVSVRCFEDLVAPRESCAQHVVLAAAWLGKARLIDNLKV